MTANGADEQNVEHVKEREVQRHYWLEHTPEKPTVETMMLDSKAGEIDKLERPEVSTDAHCVLINRSRTKLHILSINQFCSILGSFSNVM